MSNMLFYKDKIVIAGSLSDIVTTVKESKKNAMKKIADDYDSDLYDSDQNNSANDVDDSYDDSASDADDDVYADDSSINDAKSAKRDANVVQDWVQIDKDTYLYDDGNEDTFLSKEDDGKWHIYEDGFELDAFDTADDAIDYYDVNIEKIEDTRLWAKKASADDGILTYNFNVPIAIGDAKDFFDEIQQEAMLCGGYARFADKADSTSVTIYVQDDYAKEMEDYLTDALSITDDEPVSFERTASYHPKFFNK